ncbi:MULTISPECIES: phosphatase PAP2 family protein [Sediminimonas]|uniref:phosphatase PAP2 family protein n=1 Tax=Sediminimonas TaxID=659427 RepID=UPI00041B7A8B|nr:MULTISPECIES: phosphatase PAP2 family protein [Sediminimonas]MDR9486387.1 phosphatase PAP2 family protein [Sediminimonas sp.]
MKRIAGLVTLRHKVIAVVLVLAGVLALTEREVERYGDNLQIALPLLALSCEAVNGRGLEYLGRYAIMFTGLHGTKYAMGETELNTRPRGGYKGFPSGHTATASFGAATLVQRCVTGSPAVQAGVILAAALTGTSRVDAGAHTTLQVVAGAIWGLLCSMAFHDTRRPRRWLGHIAAFWRRLRGQRR